MTMKPWKKTCSVNSSYRAEPRSANRLCRVSVLQRPCFLGFVSIPTLSRRASEGNHGFRCSSLVRRANATRFMGVLRQNLRRLPWVLALLVVQEGCERRVPVGPAPVVVGNSPEAKFDWAMMRLKRALDLVRPLGHGGLRVDRKLSYELHPPRASGSGYTAQVIIESKTAYRHELPSTDQQANGSDRDAKALLGNRPVEKTKEPEGDKVLNSQETRLEIPRISDQKAYDLAYLEGRWQLQTEPESDYERMWFEYALEQ